MAIDKTKLIFNFSTGNFDAVQDVSGLLPKDGSESMTGSLDLGTHKIINVVNPTGDQDAATKKYVDDEISGLPNPITYKGTWNASTNTPTLSNSDTGVEGFLYQVSVAGSVNFGAGVVSFEIGDKVVSNGSTWQKWDMTDAVLSVNGQTGLVSLDTDDIPEGVALYFTSARARTAVLNSVTAGGIYFGNGTNAGQDATNLFWDDTNDRLGIGTATPTNALNIQKSLSGAAVSAIVQNTSATANADAHLRLTTATGGGNAHIITSYDSNYWSFGQNQADNTFKIAAAIDLTTNTALTITSAGVLKATTLMDPSSSKAIILSSGVLQNSSAQTTIDFENRQLAQGTFIAATWSSVGLDLQDSVNGSNRNISNIANMTIGSNGTTYAVLSSDKKSSIPAAGTATLTMSTRSAAVIQYSARDSSGGGVAKTGTLHIAKETPNNNTNAAISDSGVATNVNMDLLAFSINSSGNLLITNGTSTILDVYLMITYL